jgi:hypothetical protein
MLDNWIHKTVLIQINYTIEATHPPFYFPLLSLLFYLLLKPAKTKITASFTTLGTQDRNIEETRNIKFPIHYYIDTKYGP